MDQPDFRYPAGRFRFPESVNASYRTGGWTIRPVAHRVPDSHMNSYMRFRLALSEDEPVNKPCEVSRWAELADARSLPIEPSLALLESLQQRGSH